MKTCLLLVCFLGACTRALDTGTTDAELPDGSFALPDGSTALSSLDETCMASSYTGRQLLSLLKPTYSTLYAPTNPNSDTADAMWDAAHATPLTITTAWAGGAVGCAPPRTECPPGPGCFQTAPTLSLALAAGFQTADGTFDEHLVATATWTPSEPLGPNNDQTVEWQAVIPAASVKGSYQVWSGVGALGPASEVSLDFRGAFDGASASDSSVSGEVCEELVEGGANQVVESGGNGGGNFGADI